MRHLLAMLIISAILLGQGFSAGAAICHHRGAREHALARQSHDRAVAASALDEESAASVAAKKAALLGANSGAWLADLTAPTPLVPRGLTADRLAPAVLDEPALEGISNAPPLRPPHA